MKLQQDSVSPPRGYRGFLLLSVGMFVSVYILVFFSILIYCPIEMFGAHWKIRKKYNIIYN